MARTCEVERAAIIVFAMELDQKDWKRRGERYWEPLFEELRRRGVPFIDATAPIGERYGEQQGLFVGAHHSRAGNRLVAEVLRDWLEESESRPTGE